MDEAKHAAGIDTDAGPRAEWAHRFDDLSRMEVAVARGVRDETDLNRRHFETTHEQNPDVVDVLFAGDGGIIIVTDKYEREDFAWTGDLDDQELLDELVADGVLVERES